MVTGAASVFIKGEDRNVMAWPASRRGRASLSCTSASLSDLSPWIDGRPASSGSFARRQLAGGGAYLLPLLPQPLAEASRSRRARASNHRVIRQAHRGTSIQPSTQQAPRRSQFFLGEWRLRNT